MGARARRAVIAAPVVITLVIVAAVVVLVLLHRQQQARDVEAADEAAQAYLAEVSTFRADVAEAIAAAADDGPEALAAALDEHTADPPSLPESSAHGMEASAAYREAERVESALLAPYESLASVLDDAADGMAFVEAANEVMALRPTDYVGTGPITSSGPVRTSLLPAYRRALDDFDAVAVPAGQDDVAAAVHAAVQHVIDSSSTLADRLDAGQGYSFTFDEQYNRALEAVRGYATTLEGDIAEAIAAIPSGEQDTST